MGRFPILSCRLHSFTGPNSRFPGPLLALFPVCKRGGAARSCEERHLRIFHSIVRRRRVIICNDDGWLKFRFRGSMNRGSLCTSRFHEIAFPLRLKPHRFCRLYIRAEARTLRNGRLNQRFPRPRATGVWGVLHFREVCERVGARQTLRRNSAPELRVRF
jgi:hypothetical protein